MKRLLGVYFEERCEAAVIYLQQKVNPTGQTSKLNY
jgi:hypothetical protein